MKFIYKVGMLVKKEVATMFIEVEKNLVKMKFGVVKVAVKVVIKHIFI